MRNVNKLLQPGVFAAENHLGSLTAQSKAMLALLREARATVYRDSESYSEAAATLEYVGQMLRGAIGNGLHSYKDDLFELGRQAPEINSGRIENLFDTVRKARNDSVHSGDYIRHHLIRLVELFLILEEAISMTATIASDLMVHNPITAEPWNNMASIRRTMLTNSFSYLPVRVLDGNWKLIADVAVVNYLGRSSSTRERNERLGKRVSEAIQDGEIQLEESEMFSPNEDVGRIRSKINHLPILVVEGSGTDQRLIGILTAFDLL